MYLMDILVDDESDVAPVFPFHIDDRDARDFALFVRADVSDTAPDQRCALTHTQTREHSQTRVRKISIGENGN